MSTLSGPSSAFIDQLIVPRSRDIGGFEVRRALPAAGRQMVGPFIFLDEMGPALFNPGTGMDVRPHPHIGLSTVTYLFDGEILHRDSLGFVQPIRPGAVNLMTAGSGIVHSERTDEMMRRQGHRLWGLQTWLALPAASEEVAPSFVHHPLESLPLVETPGLAVRVVLGSLYGARSPVPTATETIYGDATLAAGASLPIEAGHEERALYIVSGAIEIAGDRFESGSLLVLHPGDAITVRAAEASRVMLLGGEPMDGPRHIWWNFVSSSKDRIDAAKADWQAGRFQTVPGEQEFIPLPT
jgi:redox-sensitive bicupin YhaK (pirin superfamily)